MIESLRLSLHITRRNWAVYRKDFIANISPTLADPLFYIISIGIGVGSYVPALEGHSYLQFLAPGLAVASALFTSFFESSYGFYVRMTYENIFKAMLTTPIGPREVIVGEFIWVALKGATMTLVVSLVLACFGLVENLLLLPFSVIIGLLIGLSCGAFGLIATSYVRNINQFQTVYSFFISPLFFLSGIFFPLSQMPYIAKLIAQLFPLSHGVMMAQALFWNENFIEKFTLHGLILILQCAVLCTFAYKKIYAKLQS